MGLNRWRSKWLNGEVSGVSAINELAQVFSSSKRMCGYSTQTSQGPPFTSSVRLWMGPKEFRAVGEPCHNKKASVAAAANSLLMILSREGLLGKVEEDVKPDLVERMYKDHPPLESRLEGGGMDRGPYGILPTPSRARPSSMPPGMPPSPAMGSLPPNGGRSSMPPGLSRPPMFMEAPPSRPTGPPTVYNPRPPLEMRPPDLPRIRPPLEMRPPAMDLRRPLRPMAPPVPEARPGPTTVNLKYKGKGFEPCMVLEPTCWSADPYRTRPGVILIRNIALNLTSRKKVIDSVESLKGRIRRTYNLSISDVVKLETRKNGEQYSSRVVGPNGDAGLWSDWNNTLVASEDEACGRGAALIETLCRTKSSSIVKPPEKTTGPKAADIDPRTLPKGTIKSEMMKLYANQEGIFENDFTIATLPVSLTHWQSRILTKTNIPPTCAYMPPLSKAANSVNEAEELACIDGWERVFGRGAD